MKTSAPGASPNSLPTVGGVATAPATPQTGPLPSGPDFQSLISQISSGNAANQVQSGPKATNASAATGEDETDQSLINGLLPSMASLITGADVAEKTSSNENPAGAKIRAQNSAAKSPNSVDETLAGSVMAMLAQTVLPPKPEIAVAPKASVTPNLVVGDSATSNGNPLSSVDSQTSVGTVAIASGQPIAGVDSGRVTGQAAVTGKPGEHSVKSSAENNNPAANPAQVAPAVGANAGMASDPASSAILKGMNGLAASEPAIQESAVIQAQVAAGQSIQKGTSKAVGPISRDGTGVALNKERMNNTTEKNEIAERAVKKLPRDAQTRDFSAGSGAGELAKANSDAAAVKKETIDLSFTQEINPKTTATSGEPAVPVEKSVSSAAAQVEHVSRLVTQEAMTVKQSGATSLAVSLKVDSHTQIFLQLSNTGGQMQASIRCEHGSLEGLGNHWNDLQESLARQNVQLLPLAASNTVTNNTRTASDATGGSASDSSNFQQSPGNFRRQAGDTHESPLASDEMSAPKKKLKSGASAIKGWESWA